MDKVELSLCVTAAQSVVKEQKDTEARMKKNNSIRPAQLTRELQAQRWHAMTRRRFLKLAGGAVLGGMAGTVLNACVQAPTSSSASTPGTASSPGAAQTSMPGMTMPTTTAPPSTTAANPPTSAPVATMPASTTDSVVIDGTLFIPPLLVPQVQNGTKVFYLTLQQGQSNFWQARPPQPSALMAIISARRFGPARVKRC